MIRFESVSKWFNRGHSRVVALDKLTLAVQKGEFLCAMGPSGSGKTTMLNLAGCLDSPSEGRILIDGTDLSTLGDDQLAEFRRKKVGMIFQSFNLIPTLTALENIALPLLLAGTPFSRCRQFAADVADAVGLAERGTHYPDELSGGEVQRVAIARTLAAGTEIILADEPTGNLDTETGMGIVHLLREISTRDNKTVVVATHNAEIASLSDRLVRLRDGKIV